MVRLRDRVGLNVPPLLLRLMLGVIFVFAGLGKVSVSMPVQGEEAAILANMGVIAPPAGQPAAPAAAPEAPAVKPAQKPAEPPGATGGTGPSGSAPAESEKPAAEKPAAEKPAGEKPESKPSTGKAGKSKLHGEAAPISGRLVLVRQAVPAKAYTAVDFPKPVQVLVVYKLAAGIFQAAHPGVNESGAPRMALWMHDLGEGRWPVYVAWTVALTELIGGAGLLLGLLTRVMACGVAGVMIGALWLTVIGPAIQTGQTRLGFLPNYGMMDEHWMMPELQFALLMGALALALLGPGRLSLDRAILGGPDGDEDDDEE